MNTIKKAAVIILAVAVVIEIGYLIWLVNQPSPHIPPPSTQTGKR
jgi:hypothetical protein